MPDDEQPDSYRDLDRTASVEATRVIERGASSLSGSDDFLRRAHRIAFDAIYARRLCESIC